MKKFVAETVKEEDEKKRRKWLLSIIYIFIYFW